MTSAGTVPVHVGEPISERTCWICLATESENRHATWLHPCQCRGSTKWVHESCLHRWIDEKQNGNTRMKVVCMQCRFEYLIIFPKMSRTALFLERCQDVIRRCSPFVASCASLFSVYWTAVTFGGITVLQVLGHERGMQLMEHGDVTYLLIGLPSIPVGLILSRLIRWEDAVLRFWRNRHTLLRKLPLIKWFFNPTIEIPPYTLHGDYLMPEDSNNSARIFCGAVLLPSIAVILGKLVFGSVSSPLKRTLLGGFTYIAVKGFLKIYLRERQYIQKRSRYIVDYTEENLRMYGNARRENELQARQDGGYDADDDDDYDDDDYDYDDDDSDADSDDDDDDNDDVNHVNEENDDNVNAGNADTDDSDDEDLHEVFVHALEYILTGNTRANRRSGTFLVIRLPTRPYRSLFD